MTIISASAIILDRLVISNRFKRGTFQHLVLSANYIGFGSVPYNNQYFLPKGTNPKPSDIKIVCWQGTENFGGNPGKAVHTAVAL